MRAGGCFNAAPSPNWRHAQQCGGAAATTGSETPLCVCMRRDDRRENDRNYQTFNIKERWKEKVTVQEV